jgi:tetratricopeptide (TPR) repeat protein
LNIKRLDEAKAWQKKVLDVDPNDNEATYTVAVIDWMQAHQNTLNALNPAGLNDDGVGNPKAPKKIMEPLKDQNAALVSDGEKYLNIALKIKPNYDEAMSYMNLIYRCKADLDWGNEAARKSDVAQAEDWRNKAMGTRKDNEAKKAQGPGGITMGDNGEMK